MTRSVQEVGVTKGDVLGPRSDLHAYLLQDILDGDGKEAAVVDWCNWAVAAGVLAPPRRLGKARRNGVAIVQQLCIVSRKAARIGNRVILPRQ